MGRFTWTRPHTVLVRAVMKKARVAKLIFGSLFYNEHISLNYAFDTLLEPIFWLVDHFTGVLGPAFVTAVVGLTGSVVVIAYAVGLPYYWSKSPWLAVLLVTSGQFFFVNIVFNYWMALRTGPGRPPKDATKLTQVTAICKKCIAPKPPRTHHCSVCNQCILKMDHHCPWLNACVGAFNHRYFFLYMVYTVLGCLFVMIFGFEIVYKELFPAEPQPSETKLALDFRESEPLYLGVFTRRSLILYETFITSGCFLILGALAIWHAKLITRGETSIEAHINRSEAKRLAALGKEYQNPYDFSAWYNWCLFLGLIEGRGWASVLWPSRHRPRGNGLEWDTIYSCSVPWNHDYSAKDSDAKIA